MKPNSILFVGAGGFLGAITRYVVGTFVAGRLGTAWPFATFVINISGCFAVGFSLTLMAEGTIANDAWRYLVPIGFIGAYTTFSTFSYETVRLLEDGAWIRAVSYVVLSTLVGLAAVAAAILLARRM